MSALSEAGRSLLEERIRQLSVMQPMPGGGELPVLPFFHVLDMARSLGRSRNLRQKHPRGMAVALVERTALAMGVCPERYQRNLAAYSLAEQLRLLESCAAQVGLGGLGGHLLELLARAGVGSMHAADGDEFVPSNLNRQLYATRRSLGGYKAAAAAARMRLVNPALNFEPVASFLAEEDMGRFLAGAQVCLDALGGLADRAALLRQAGERGIPVVTAAVAGTSGVVATVLPGGKGPADFFGQGAAAEDTLGTPAPAVAAAASLMASEALSILCGRGPRLAGKLLAFDLDRMSFETLSL